MARRWVEAGFVLAALVASRAAFAQEEPPGPTLRRGAFAFLASLQIGASKGGKAFEPVSIAPDAWYGVSDRLEVGVVTSWVGMTGFWSGAMLGFAPSGLCTSHRTNAAGIGCPKRFDNAGAEAHYALLAEGSFQLAAGGGLHATSFDPFTLDVKLGTHGMWRAGRVGLSLAPSLFIGVTQRHDPPDGTSNKESIQLPIAVTFAALPQLLVGLQSGVRGPLDGFGDAYSIPAALGAIFLATPQIMVGGAFSFERVAGGDDLDPGDLRSMTLSAGYML
ncbi:MAG TPA: hypothetical protein VFU21_13830 [Kofleriaceae bacterium]|nr:hypothetical protein [Kofleriaceae bacterium]